MASKTDDFAILYNNMTLCLDMDVFTQSESFEDLLIILRQATDLFNETYLIVTIL